MSWRALCWAWRWRASAIPFDCTTERWSDCYPRPPGARRADSAPTLNHAASVPAFSANEERRIAVNVAKRPNLLSQIQDGLAQCLMLRPNYSLLVHGWNPADFFASATALS